MNLAEYLAADRKIVDFHVHFPPGCESRPDIGTQLIRNAMPYGIAACVVSHLFGKYMGENIRCPLPQGVRQANLFAADQCRLNPGRLFFMGYINPQNPDWMEEMDRCIALGACGIKLWVSLKDADGSMENTVKVLRRAAALGKCVYLHVFNRTGGNLPGEITMAEFAELARAVPACRMVAGHTGGNWRRSAEIIEHCPENVWMETGGSNPDYGMVDGILKFCPPERLLYGSDGPGRAFFPQIWKYLESSLAPADLERVFFRNALELLQLPEPLPADGPRAVPQTAPGPEKIDHCCFCGHYSFEPRPELSPSELESRLEEADIGQAYTADLETVFSSDLIDGNRKFLSACRELKRVRPLAVIDPSRPDRETVLDEVLSDPGWCGLWLSPAFHLWRPDDPSFAGFFRRCAAGGKHLFINCGFYEPRFFAPELRIRTVPDGELMNFLKEYRFERCIIQGVIPPDGAGELPHCLWSYTRLTDLGGALDRVMKLPSAPKLVRGSEFPFRHLQETLAAAQLAGFQSAM